MKLVGLFLLLFCGKVMPAQNPLQQKQDALPVYSIDENQKTEGDWLLGSSDAITRVFKSSNGKDLIISNGLIYSPFRIVRPSDV